MQVPVSMLKTAGGSKGVALLALLAGLVIVTVVKNQQRSTSATP